MTTTKIEFTSTSTPSLLFPTIEVSFFADGVIQDKKSYPTHGLAEKAKKEWNRK